MAEQIGSAHATPRRQRIEATHVVGPDEFGDGLGRPARAHWAAAGPDVAPGEVVGREQAVDGPGDQEAAIEPTLSGEPFEPGKVLDSNRCSHRFGATHVHPPSMHLRIGPWPYRQGPRPLLLRPRGAPPISMTVVAWLIAAAISFVSGGFAIRIGFALGLHTIAVHLAAVAGSLAGLAVFLFAGEKVRSRLMVDREVTSEQSRVREFADRYGPRSLGIVGPIFPGVTASVVLGLALGMDESALARRMSIGIAATFGLYCGGLWPLIELVGVE